MSGRYYVSRRHSSYIEEYVNKVSLSSGITLISASISRYLFCDSEKGGKLDGSGGESQNLNQVWYFVCLGFLHYHYGGGPRWNPWCCSFAFLLPSK